MAMGLGLGVCEQFFAVHTGGPDFDLTHIKDRLGGETCNCSSVVIGAGRRGNGVR